MTKEEIRQCFIIMRKNDEMRRRFRNPYIRKLRQNSIRGTLSKSNDNLSMSITQKNAINSSSSVIEEEIIVGGNSGTMSLSKSMSLTPGLTSAKVRSGSQTRFLKLLGGVNVQRVNPNKLQARNEYVIGEESIGISNSVVGLPLKSSSNQQTSSDCAGLSGSSEQIQHSTVAKKQSGDSSSHALTTGEMKRLIYSQKHESSKLKGVGAKPHGSNGTDQAPRSNSLVKEIANMAPKVRSCVTHSNDGGSFQSDPAKLIKFSSGSDSYCLP